MSKRLLFIFSLIVVLSLVGNVLAQDADVVIRNPDMAMPVIDGIMDEVWSSSTELPIENHIVDSAPDSPADCSGTFRALWDWDHIYVWAEVNDEALQADSGQASSYQDDSFEFYIDADNSKGDTIDENDHQYCFAWNNGEVEEPRAYHHGEPSLVGVEYAVVTTGSGYLFELRIPWTSITEEPPAPGQLIGIDGYINDDDDGGNRDSQISWHSVGNSWNIPSDWGTAQLVAGNKAGVPHPADGAMHPETWASLSWMAGPTAVSHDIYFGEDYDTVDDATHDSEVYRANQTLTYFVVGFPGYPYPEGLVPGTTYYWRIDEINAEGTVYEGVVWSFSIPPKTAYGPNPADGAEFVGPDVTLVWNGGFGAKLHHVYLSDNRADVEAAAPGAYKGAQGLATYDAGTLETEKVYYWRIDEFDGFETYEGGVWSFTTPGTVGNPKPAYGATDVGMNATLSWAPAGSAASHQLYFGTDKQAVLNADAGSPEYQGSIALDAESYDPGLLEAETTYYWRVDEVDSQGNVSTGPLWTFSTGAFLLIEDFEAYTDNDAAGEAIWQTWIDGFGVADNGAQVGYLMPSYVELNVVHGGAQSMPLVYENVNGVTNSEAALPLSAMRDWTLAGVERLSLWYQGRSANAAEPMYVAISNSAGAPAIVANEDALAAQARGWMELVIPLQAFADQGINLTNVDKIAIGLGSKGGASGGGTGTMYIDDIRLDGP